MTQRVEEWIRDGWLLLSADGTKVLLPDSTRKVKPADEVAEVETELWRRIFLHHFTD